MKAGKTIDAFFRKADKDGSHEIDFDEFKLLFKNMKTDSVAFDKCRITDKVLEKFKESLDLKKIQLITCDLRGLDFSKLGEI